MAAAPNTTARYLERHAAAPCCERTGAEDLAIDVVRHGAGHADQQAGEGGHEGGEGARAGDADQDLPQQPVLKDGGSLITTLSVALFA